MASMVIIINIALLFLMIRVNILHLGVLISQEGDLNLSGYIPAMELALESIKNDTSLPFDFSVTLNDSMVSWRDHMMLLGFGGLAATYN